MNKRIEDFAAVSSFLLWLEADDPNAMWGGHRVSDVIDALCRLMGIPADELRARLKP